MGFKVYHQHACFSCLPSIPLVPLLEPKIFHLLVSFLFYAPCIILRGIYCLRLFCLYAVCLSCCWNCVCPPSLLIRISYILPEATCCCLQTCNVNVVLLVMYCMCLLAFIVTITQLWVCLISLLIIILLKAVCCCLQTCNVLMVLLLLYCICVQLSWSLVLISASYNCLRLFVVVYKPVMFVVCC